MTVLKKLPTPDKPAAMEYRQVLLTVPSNADLERHLWGALSAIAFWSEWDEVGTMTAIEAAWEMKNVLLSRMEFSMLGVIVPVIREVLPSYMLLCNGGVYNRSDYPQLWDVWPSAMKSATDLTLPDLTDRFLRMASLTNPVGTVGGAAEVTLTEAEMPVHTHQFTSPTFNIDVEGVGIPDPTGVGNPPFPATTSPTGGGLPHENLPPFYSIDFAVIAKVQP